MSKIILIAILFSITLANFVHADIISINSGGDSQFIINSDGDIEGFFFGDIQTGSIGSGGGGGSNYRVTLNQKDICNLSKNYIETKNKKDYDKLKKDIESIVHTDLNDSQINDIIKGCSPGTKIISEIKSNVLYLIIPILLILIIIIVYKRSKSTK